MGSNVIYLLFDAATGEVAYKLSCPIEHSPNIPDGMRAIYCGDGFVPHWQARVDLRKARRLVTHAASVLDVLTSSTRAEPKVPGFVAVDTAKWEAIHALDAAFAQEMTQLLGPLAAVHAEKRRQAEAGGGPLVADEADRLAILAAAAAQDELLAGLERDRRAAKTALRKATSMKQVEKLRAVRNGKAGLKAI